MGSQTEDAKPPNFSSSHTRLKTAFRSVYLSIVLRYKSFTALEYGLHTWELLICGRGIEAVEQLEQINPWPPGRN